MLAIMLSYCHLSVILDSRQSSLQHYLFLRDINFINYLKTLFFHFHLSLFPSLQFSSLLFTSIHLYASSCIIGSFLGICVFALLVCCTPADYIYSEGFSYDNLFFFFHFFPPFCYKTNFPR